MNETSGSSTGPQGRNCPGPVYALGLVVVQGSSAVLPSWHFLLSADLSRLKYRLMITLIISISPDLTSSTQEKEKKKANYSLAWLLWANKFFHIISHIRKAGESLRENKVLTFLGNKCVSFSFLKSKINKSRGSLLCVCMPAQFIYLSGTTEYPLRLLLKDVLFWNQTLDYRPCNIFSSVP